MPETTDDSDFSLVTTQKLLSLIKERHDAVLIVTENFRTSEQTETWFDYSGGLSVCIGLATRAQRRLLDRAQDKE